MNRKGGSLDVDFEESGSQSLLLIMASKKYTSVNFGKEFFCCGKKIVKHSFHSGKLGQK